MRAKTVADAPARSFRSWLKEVLGSVLVLVFGLALALLVGEAAARVVFRNSLDFDMEMWKYATQVKLVTDDTSTGYVQRPNAQTFLMGTEVTTNSYGLRDEDIALEKPPNTYRVLAVGDSVTFGWGVPQDETYPAQLERLLNASPPTGLPDGLRYEVLNLGIGNYNSAQEVAWLREVGLQFDPDLILLGYFINDAEPTPQPNRGFLIENSYLYVYAVSRLRTVAIDDGALLTYEEYYRGLYAEGQSGWQGTQDALAELVEIGREQDVPVVMFIIPELHDLSAAYPFADIHDTLVEIGSDIGLSVVDLYPAFSGYSPEEDLWVTPSDAHHNALAQSMIAQGIYDALETAPDKP